MSGSLDVLNALQAGSQGKYAPPAGVVVPPSPGDVIPYGGGPTVPGGGLGDRAFLEWQQSGGKGAPPPRVTPPLQTDPAADVMSALQAGGQGKFTPPPVPEQQQQNPANVIPGGLYAGMADLTNLGIRGVNAAGGLFGAPPIPQMSTTPPGYQPPESGLPAMTYEALRAVPNALPIAGTGNLLGAGLRAAGPIAARAAPLFQFPMVPAVAASAGAGGAEEGAKEAGLGPWGQLGAGVAGGVLTGGIGPAILERGLNRMLPNEVLQGQAGESMTATAPQIQSAAKQLQKALGPQFEATQAAVNAAPPSDIPQTVAQVTAQRPEEQPLSRAAGLELSARNFNPDTFRAVDQARSNAMAGAIQGLKEPNDPAAIGQMFVQQLQERENALAANATQARTAAQDAGHALGAPRVQAEIGGEARDLTIAGNTAMKRPENSIYDALESDPSITLGIVPLKQAEQSIVRSYKPKVEAPIEGPLNRVLGQIRSLPSVIPYPDLIGMTRQINGLLREGWEGKPLADVTVKRLTALRDAAYGSIQQAATEAAAGTNPAFAAEMRAASGAGTSVESAGLPSDGEASGGVGSGGDAGSDRGNGPQEVPQRTLGSGGSLPAAEAAPGGEEGGLTPNFPPEKAAEYQTARNLTAQRKGIYGEGTPVGSTILTRGPGGPNTFKTPDAAIMGRILSGVDAPQKFANLSQAIGLDAAQRLARESIVRDMIDKGVIGPDGILDAKKHAGYLRGPMGQIVDQIPGLREQIGDAATAQRTVDAAELARKNAIDELRDGVAGRFLSERGLPTDPQAAVQDAMKGQFPGRVMTQIINAAGNNTEALASLRGHVADELARRFTTASELPNEGDIEGAKAALNNANGLRSYLRDNKDWLKRLYPGNGGQAVHTIEQIAAEIRRAQSIRPAAIGSPTASYFRSAERLGVGHGNQTIFGWLWATLGEKAAGALAHGVGATHPLAEGAVEIGGALAGLKMNAMRQAGIESRMQLASFAMAHPGVFKVLAERVPEGVGQVAMRRASTAIRAAALGDEMRRATGGGGDNAPGQ